MKNVALIILFGAAIALASCSDAKKNAAGQEDHAAHQHQAAATDTTAVAAAYICPMKCEGSASDKPGKCPVCKMDLVAVEDEAGSEQ